MTKQERINQLSDDSMPCEADEINDSDLFAAADMLDDLINGTFYAKQEASGFAIKYIN